MWWYCWWVCKIIRSLPMKFIRNWTAIAALLAIGFGMGLCALTRAATPAPTAPAVDLATWVHVFGCPRPAAHVVLVFTNGKIVVLQDSTLTDDQKAKLLKIVGKTQGVNIQYDCGAKT
jgi:hypothetical protein